MKPCWGYNGYNQLGTLVNHLSGVRQISAGFYHTVALTAAGNVMAWGFADGTRPSNGDGTNTQRADPVYVLTSGTDQSTNRLSGVVRVSAGSYYSCALLATSEVMCWGDNPSGQLGDGTTTDRLNAVYVLTSGSDQSANHLTGAVSITAGDAHTCATLNTGKVMCWGLGTGGRLGDGDAAAHTALNPSYVLESGANPNTGHQAVDVQACSTVQ